jgi:hypothetical protein
MASSARARVASMPARQIDRAEHDGVVRAFAAAANSGDLGALTSALDPNVVVRSDGGGVVTAARNRIEGADKVARYLLGALSKRQGSEVLEQETQDSLGFAVWREAASPVSSPSKCSAV